MIALCTGYEFLNAKDWFLAISKASNHVIKRKLAGRMSRYANKSGFLNAMEPRVFSELSYLRALTSTSWTSLLPRVLKLLHPGSGTSRLLPVCSSSCINYLAWFRLKNLTSRMPLVLVREIDTQDAR